MTRIRQLTLLAVLCSPLVASAHFKLNSPPSMSTQSSLGDPQKSDPCGQDDPGFVLTNEVTTVAPGSTIEIDVSETIFHRGHFRVALADSMGNLPADPPITPVNNDPCGSTVIDPNPTLPVLGDGLLPHTAKIPDNSKISVTLPNAECPNCVLQVIQYMSNHGAPCFYHHCAVVNVSNSAPPPVDGAPPPGQEAGVDPPTGGVDSGCCSASTSSPTGILLGFCVGALLLRRRRR